MRITFVDSWPAEARLGGRTAAARAGLRSGLLALGHEVVTLRPQAAPRGSVAVHRLLFNLAVPRLLKTIAADLVVGFDFDGVFWARRRRPQPYVVALNRVAAEARQRRPAGTRQPHRLFAWLEGDNARRADGVVTPSRHLREAVIRHYRVDPARLRVVPAGIDLPHWRASAPASWDGATILGVVCRDGHAPAADLLGSLAIVRRTIPAAHAVLVSDGREQETLCRLAETLDVATAVHVRNAAEETTLRDSYRNADVFCAPSVDEGDETVYVQAMASGLPIVATTAAAVPEIVPSEAGVLVPPGNVEALAEALVALLRSPARRRELGEGGLRVAAEYDWPRVARRFLDELERPAS
ncbi:MAG: glycosyl transferase family 1 [Dehalococcoidia bacterium]|nr:MAG: glycosyl transferase family 1 [Dehalococcoidia bacterium]